MPPPIIELTTIPASAKTPSPVLLDAAGAVAAGGVFKFFSAIDFFLL
jgi:hypothetical protein